MAGLRPSLSLKMRIIEIYLSRLQRMLWRIVMRIASWMHRKDGEASSLESAICLSECAFAQSILTRSQTAGKSPAGHSGAAASAAGHQEYRIEKDDLQFFYEMWLTTSRNCLMPFHPYEVGVVYESMSRTLAHKRQVPLDQVEKLSFLGWCEKIKCIPCTIQSETRIPRWLLWLFPARLHLCFYADANDARRILRGRRWRIPGKCTMLMEQVIISSNR